MSVAWSVILSCGAALLPQVQEDDVSAAEVEGLVVEADAYSLASHLLWAMWGLLQSKVGGIYS